jgi:hypothetical protein
MMGQVSNVFESAEEQVRTHHIIESDGVLLDQAWCFIMGRYLLLFTSCARAVVAAWKGPKMRVGGCLDE